jgi:hypothetical protein
MQGCQVKLKIVEDGEKATGVPKIFGNPTDLYFWS